MNDSGQETRLDGSRAAGIAAVVAVSAVVVAGIVLTVLGLRDGSHTGPSTSDLTPTSSPSGVVSEPAGGSVCGLNKVKLNGALSKPPSKVTWSLVGGIAVPATPTAGPGQNTLSGVRYCYARTPAGALMMAANTYTWGSVAPSGTVDIVERQFARGPGFDSALQQARSAADAPAQNPPASATLQIRGFRLGFYDGTSAVVDLVVQDRDGAFYAQVFELVWEDGDWRLRVGPTGDIPSGRSVPDATGYVPWSGA